MTADKKDTTIVQRENACPEYEESEHSKNCQWQDQKEKSMENKES